MTTPLQVEVYLFHKKRKRPRPSFTYVADGLEVTFTDTSTKNPVTYLWDFGDGNTSTLQNPVHTYAEAGEYTVTLTAFNRAGGRSTSQAVTVEGATASASFTYVTDALEVTFTDTSTGATSWSWDFGDSNTSTLQNPSHTYAAAGHYTVTLTINAGADSDVQSVPVNAFEAALQTAGFARIYQLRETTGTTAVNTGTDGAAGNAIIYSSPTLGVADITGNPDAADFSDTTMQLEFPAVFLTDNDFTMLWLLRGVGNVPTSNDLFNGIGNTDIFNVNINAISGALSVALSTENGTADLITATGTFSADTDYLIFVRYNATTGQLDTRYSTDGTLTSPTLTSDTQVLPSPSADQLTIVYSNPANTGTTTRLGCIAFTQTRLSDAELLAIAESIWP